MTISVVLMMLLYWSMKQFGIRMLEQKERKKTLNICAQPGIDPGPLAS